MRVTVRHERFSQLNSLRVIHFGIQLVSCPLCCQFLVVFQGCNQDHCATVCGRTDVITRESHLNCPVQEHQLCLQTMRMLNDLGTGLSGFVS